MFQKRNFRMVMRDRRGATAIIFAALAMIMFGFAALAIEGGNWYYQQRQQRTASDMGAMAGASAAYWRSLYDQTGPSSAAAHQAALDTAFDTARRNGFTTGGRVQVTVNHPPINGRFVGDYTAVQVDVRQTIPTYISALFLPNEPIVHTRAVARFRYIGDLCLLSLTGTLTLSGSTSVEMPNCVLASNSRQNPSIQANLPGNANKKGVIAAALYGAGNIEDKGNIEALVLRNQPPLPDPFANRMPVINPTCSGQTAQTLNSRLGNNTVWDQSWPTNICGTGGNGNNNRNTITIGTNQTLDLRPGTYFFYDTSLVVRGTLTCSQCSGITGGEKGVTLVFAGNDPGVFSANSTALIQLNAPNSGAFEDILIYRVSDEHNGGKGNFPEITINGSAQSFFTGSIYAPTTKVSYLGNSEHNFHCTYIVAHTITFSGNSDITANCREAGVDLQRINTVMLVE